jgi:hypothetical protein
MAEGRKMLAGGDGRPGGATGALTILAALLVAGCAAATAPQPIDPNRPFVVEGVGPASAFIYPEEIRKDVARQLGSNCANGFDVIDLATQRGPTRMTSDVIRYRALVQCRAT